MRPATILFVFGTRPEAIKLAPVIEELRRDPESFDVRVCVTGQRACAAATCTRRGRRRSIAACSES